MLKVDHEKCTGCGTCLDTCTVEAISLISGKADIDYILCNGCEECADVCPSEAIIPVKEPLPIEIIPSQSMSAHKSQTTVVSPSRKITPWIGATLTLVSRELLPRFADALVIALEKRLVRPARTMPEFYPHTEHEGLGMKRRQRRRAGRR